MSAPPYQISHLSVSCGAKKLKNRLLSKNNSRRAEMRAVLPEKNLQYSHIPVLGYSVFYFILFLTLFSNLSYSRKRV